MCGFFYSNFGKNDNISFQNLSNRGPDGESELLNDLGYFYHCRLATRDTEAIQPVSNNYGTLLYNGTEYALKEKDTDYIINNLTDNIKSNFEFLKQLDGDFSICYVTNEHIFLARDWIGTKPLFYSHCENNIVVSSTEHAIKSIGLTPIQIKFNTLLILNRLNGSILNELPIADWDLTQGTKTLDDVCEAFEKSVMDRFESNCVLTLSSGYDSGIIDACLQKYSKIYTVAVWKNGVENNNVINSRLDNRSNLAEFIDIDFDAYPEFDAATIRDFNENVAAIARKNNTRIILTGSGGDELYSDYGFNGKPILHFSKFNGLFTKDLNDIWPWHSYYKYPLCHDVALAEYINGSHGIDTRHPLLDKKLFQIWLNTSVEIKNKSYKYWIEQYLNIQKYPYAMEKIGIVTKKVSKI